MKTSKTAITLALTASLGSAGVALAGENPFAMQVLEHGYQLAGADGKAKDGSCGGTKAEEAKCGANKNSAAAATSKAKDGKCGEGKCGANKAKGGAPDSQK